MPWLEDLERNENFATRAVRAGTRRDAILFAVGANGDHGLRRTNEDKRRSVLVLLRDEEWGAKSDRWIATQAGVSNRLETFGES